MSPPTDFLHLQIKTPVGDSWRTVSVRCWLNMASVLHVTKSALGTGIVAFDYHDYSWQNFIENTVLGLNVSHTKLSEAEIAATTLSKFGVYL